MANIYNIPKIFTQSFYVPYLTLPYHTGKDRKDVLPPSAEASSFYIIRSIYIVKLRS